MDVLSPFKAPCKSRHVPCLECFTAGDLQGPGCAPLCVCLGVPEPSVYAIGHVSFLSEFAEK